MSAKLHVAKALYRWGLATGILQPFFSALSFFGIFTLLLGPYLVAAGLPYFALLPVVLAILPFGLILDRYVRFWTATATVSTARNQYLVDSLYQKELLLLKASTLPQLEVMRYLMTNLPANVLEPKFMDHRQQLILGLDANISRIKQAVADKKWVIETGEDVYGQ
jgi:hypothetical protein